MKIGLKFRVKEGDHGVKTIVKGGYIGVIFCVEVRSYSFLVVFVVKWRMYFIIRDPNKDKCNGDIRFDRIVINPQENI